MIEFASLSPAVQATVLLVVVLVEAVALYAGYGVVERAVAPPLIETIENA
ncbi:DUF7512 family protein [Halobiforma nitratireducens]|uniref:Uncharacterized protein n=1 Tax=Halobiforma nitratireducens JCM 10879 TaxID=1227454 RepID=M0MD85_9EURY|nr:hypothetical protein [Halobiforma nitratireducens]EMA42609.1 hypothetical protein C446_04078 [Halobiforma nitratireducens JCM 10879]